LRSIYAQAPNKSFEVIVVDNDSSDGSADAISAEFPDVQLFRSQKNIGFGPANNLAAKKALGRRILFLNPDTLIIDHAIDRLTEFADAHRSAQIWGRANSIR
jgi:GT2 family glycosyltransferase